MFSENCFGNILINCVQSQESNEELNPNENQQKKNARLNTQKQAENCHHNVAGAGRFLLPQTWNLQQEQEMMRTQLQ